MILDEIILKIEELNPVHGKKLRKSLPLGDTQYRERAETFLKSYIDFVAELNKDIEYGIACYLRMCADVVHETLIFRDTGEYSSKSFVDTNRRVYANPEVMDYYMHALILSEFLWAHHYKVFSYFVNSLPKYRPQVARYLEIGAGHGLFVSEAGKLLDPNVQFDVVDISPSSLAMTKRFVRNEEVSYMLMDVFKYYPSKRYDFITMGEVLEHVEQPVALLEKVRDLLNPGGVAYITTPTNAPAIDHIYLFKNSDDIRNVIRMAGLRVVDEFTCFAENVTPEVARDLKITEMYAAFLKKI